MLNINSYYYYNCSEPLEKEDMDIKQKTLIFIVLTLLISMSFFSGCVDPIDDPVLPQRGFFMGILPNPAPGEDFADSYAKAADHAEFVPIWSVGAGASGFWDYAEKLSGWWGNTFIKEYIRGNDMFPLIHFSFMDQDDQGNLVIKTPDSMPEATLQDEEWRDSYKTSVLEVINTIHPKYLSLGNEVNRWYELYGNDIDNPNGFQHFVSLYEEIYDSVKAIAPDTQIFFVFAREIVKENREADLEVLSLFNEEKVDILAVTTYPYAVQGINQPADISSDYYQQVSAYMPQTPFGFTEIGWSSHEAFGGQQGQSDFLIDLSTRLTKEQDIDLHLFGYIWLHDQPGGDTTGLITQDGTEKLGYNTWKQISRST
jgi:hypothetical protein